MSNPKQHPTPTGPDALSPVHQARAAVSAVDRTVRTEGLAGPAEAYHVMGSLGVMLKTLHCSLDEIAAWWRTQERRHHLRVVEGPFADDPHAAAQVAVEALAQASAACTHAYAALERAHIATAQIEAELDPRDTPPRTWPRRRPRP